MIKKSFHPGTKGKFLPSQKNLRQSEEFELNLKEFIAEWRKKRGRKSEQDVLLFFLDYFCVKKKIPFNKLQATLERALLVRIMSELNGNQREAARILGIKYTTLNEKIKKHHISFQKTCR